MSVGRGSQNGLEKERERDVSLKEAIVAKIIYLASAVDEGNTNTKQ